jgi:RimJ/RimL family protein N-acetyltransferase
MENNDKLNDLLCVFKNNIEHLFYWLRPFFVITFNHIYEIKNYYKKNEDICYAIFYNSKIIGCINIGKLEEDEEKLSYRTISYWIDKNHVRKGIMYNCLKSFEKIFKDNALDYIMASIQEKNIPSVNLVKKMGFEKLYGRVDLYTDEETGDEVNMLPYRKKLSERARQYCTPHWLL